MRNTTANRTYPADVKDGITSYMSLAIPDILSSTSSVFIQHIPFKYENGSLTKFFLFLYTFTFILIKDLLSQADGKRCNFTIFIISKVLQRFF